MKIEIIYEDAALLVIYKPAGLASQSARVTQPDVVSEAMRYLKTAYIGLVHRLDQPVEGLLVLAKTKSAAANLTRQLAEGTLKKSYYAMCLCEKTEVLSEQPMELTDYLLKNVGTGKADIVTDLPSGKRPKEAKCARLTYRWVRKKPLDESFADMGQKYQLAVADVALMTGRFHQIRAQMANAGFPLLGDLKYGTLDAIRVSEQTGTKNVALCAYALSFLHPNTKKKLDFTVRPRNPIFEE